MFRSGAARADILRLFGVAPSRGLVSFNVLAAYPNGPADPDATQLADGDLLAHSPRSDVPEARHVHDRVTIA